MKELFVGLSTLCSALAAAVALFFEPRWTDLTSLMNQISRSNRNLEPGEAKTLATNKRKRQKRVWLGGPLVLALAFSVVALCVNNGETTEHSTRHAAHSTLKK